MTTFAWRNDHYAATVDAAGLIQLDGMLLGKLVVAAEHGDTYSEERGATLGVMQPTGPLIVEERSAHHSVLCFPAAWQDEARQVTATVRVTFDPSPLIRWQIDLDSRGADLRVELQFETGKQGQIYAAMPFDVVARPVVDTDLLPRESPAELQKYPARPAGAERSFHLPLPRFCGAERRDGNGRHFHQRHPLLCCRRTQEPSACCSSAPSSG